MLIVIEGCDASGKATQSKLLASALNAARFSFPRYDGPVGRVILKHLKGQVVLHDTSYAEDGTPVTSPFDPLILQALMTMDKYAAAPYINAHLAAGRHVVLDRYWQSAVCYGSDDGVSEELLLDAHTCLPKADLNFFLDVEIEEATRRRPQARDRYEQDKVKLERIRRKYRALWADNTYREPYKWIVIDGHQDVNLLHGIITSKVVQRKEQLDDTDVALKLGVVLDTTKLG